MRYNELITSLLLVLLSAVPSYAAVEATFPLQGFYRPGRYMPVQVRATIQNPPANSTLEISIDGAMPTRILLKSGQVDTYLPLLAAESMKDANWRARISGRESAGVFAQRFRPLGPEQRLVGFAAPIDLSGIADLVDKKTIIPIQLDAANPLPGIPEAWETLDAIILESGARMEESTIEALLDAGVTIAVRSSSQPSDPRFDKQYGNYWAASRPIAGPVAGGENSMAFIPVDSWHASWPAAFRKRVVLYAVVFSVLVLGIALTRIRFAPLLIVSLSLIFTIGLWAWWQGRSAILQRSGTIRVLGNKLVQDDNWTYLASPSPSATQEAWSAGVHPFFESRYAQQILNLALICTEDGLPQFFDFKLSPGIKIGFLSRSFLPPASATYQPVSKSLLELFAQKIYLGQGDRIVGELPPQDQENRTRIGEQWATVVIEHQARR
jgi:hypothetical protein